MQFLASQGTPHTLQVADSYVLLKYRAWERVEKFRTPFCEMEGDNWSTTQNLYPDLDLKRTNTLGHTFSPDLRAYITNRPIAFFIVRFWDC